MVDADLVHFVGLSIIDVSAIAINLFLITAIIKRTPMTMRSYSALLLFTAVTDCIAASASLMATTMYEELVSTRAPHLVLFSFLCNSQFIPPSLLRIENHEGSVIYVYTGPCRLVHARVCYAAQAINVQCLGESCMLLLVSFAYRLSSFSFSIHTGSSVGSRAKLLAICFVATIPAVITAVTFTNSPSPPTQSLLEHPRLAGRLFSVFNLTASHLLSTENLLPRVSIGYIICLYTLSSPILCVLRWKFLAKLRLLGSSSDRHSQHQIFRSLTLQMLLPLSFSLSFVFWIVDFLEIYRCEALQRLIMPITSTFTVISPLIIIYYLPPYKKFFLETLSFNSKKHLRKASVIPVPSAHKDSIVVSRHLG